MGRLAEAEARLREALDVARQGFGEVHVETAREQHHLAVLLWKQGKYREAEPYFEAAVAALTRTQGPAHRVTRNAIANHAHNLVALGDARRAEATARDALARYRQAPTDRLVAGALIALGHALGAQHRPQEARALLREALDTLDPATERRRQWWKGEAQSTLGAVLAAEGAPAEGEQLMLAGYEALRDLPAAPPPLLRAAIERLVTHYTQVKRASDAAEWRSRLKAVPTASAPSTTR